MKGGKNVRTKSPEQNNHTNGNSGNGHKSELDIFMANREKRLLEIYKREWNSEEIEELREKMERLNAEAREAGKAWEKV